MKALESCANGDGNPICPPSKVICKECMDKISSTLEDIISKLEKPKEEKMDKDEQEQIDKQTDQFTKEIWELKQKIGKLECYIGFRNLWGDFESLSKQDGDKVYENKCEDGTQIPEGGCFGCEEGSLCE